MKIKNVSTILKEYLHKKFGEPETTDLDFSFALPNKGWVTENKANDWVNIYLLETKDNLELRSSQRERSYKDGNVIDTKSPFYVDLYYILTFYAYYKSSNAALDPALKEYEHLETALLALYDFCDSEDVPEVMRLEMYPRPYIEEQLNLQLWSALDQDVRPFISLKVTIPLESEVSKKYTPVKEDGKTIVLYHKRSLYGRVLVKEQGTPDSTAKPYESQNNAYAKVKITNQGGTTIYMKEIETDALGMFEFVEDKKLDLDEKELFLKANAEDYDEKEIKLVKDMKMPIEIILIKN